MICHEPESFLFGFSGDVCNDKEGILVCLSFIYKIKCNYCVYDNTVFSVTTCRTLATPIKKKTILLPYLYTTQFVELTWFFSEVKFEKEIQC